MQGPVLMQMPREEKQQLVAMEAGAVVVANAAAAAAAATSEMESCFTSSFRKGEFPPPLPSLARKSYRNLPLQVPWCNLQANRANNRVVLHEVKSGQQMLFQPIRKGGRLVLHMLRSDSDEEVDSDGTASSPSPSAAAVESVALEVAVKVEDEKIVV